MGNVSRLLRPIRLLIPIKLVTVYNLQGHIIFQQYMTANEQVYVATGAGIFVVRGESEAIKVIVE